MAPERMPRAGGFGQPGMRNSALATAALTSVALFSQTADAAPQAVDDGPSREEVQQRVSTLYDRAESDTGNFNATRAMTASTRGRGASTGNIPRQASDPELDNVARRWFDAARSSVGPTIPAVLPADRMPARPAVPRPARPADDLIERKRDVPELPAGPTARPVAELTAGPVAELTAGPAPALTGRAIAALPAVPTPRPELQPAVLRGLPPTAPATPSRQASLRTAKERNQRKLATARELLSRYTGQRTAPALAIEAAPAPVAAPWSDTAQQAQRMAEEEWRLRQPSVLDTGVPAAQTWQPNAYDTGAIPAQTWQSGGFDTGAMPAQNWQSGGFDTGAIPTQNWQPSVLDTGAMPAQNWQPSAYDTGAVPAQNWQPSVLDTGATPAQNWQPSVLDTGATPAQNWQPSVLDTGVPAAQAWQPNAYDTGAVPAPTWQPGVLDTGAIPAQNWQPSVLDTGVPADLGPAVGSKAERAIAFARAQIGRPCVWGSIGPGSYDDSGLTQTAWKSAGVALPRAAQEQASAGTVVPLAESRPGDLIFYNDNFSHVGIYTGDGMMVHAPGPGTCVREESVYYAGEAAVRIAVRPV
ncbi:NlpC/P60 family protein [Streptomyces pseudovenezuelae]|uniref:Cell wall-associated NlpC family hydrolase n=1 Tax=Streptomyces pseudovenezuelae TaxID=67350 RepID=A0ABT6LNH4_9ACTN|nr:cell wall-associated NlpC family hydrolase [Streptomyces pseudovenezuelae]